MRLYHLLFFVVFLSACSSPTPLTLIDPTTKAAALVRVTDELTVLAPIITQESSPFNTVYYVADDNKRAATSQERLQEATELLEESPDLINKMVEDFSPNMLSSKKAKLKKKTQLQSWLQTHPNLDLGWAWLAGLQEDQDQAITSLSKAIALNGQVGYYYSQRALRYFLQGNYSAAIDDDKKALTLYHNRSAVYKELADTYAMMQDDNHFTETSDLRIAEMRQALNGLRKSTSHELERIDSLRLREEIGYAYLTKALYFIENRKQPALGCKDLSKAIAYNVAEAAELQRKHCR
ncbi:hypothetical protein [Hymenobacter defluvii]|uniref:Tetratricopeptide repeat protein n=1 Tax=Hymenobacter defluvii TaxID=2054411 RepID=A0ABS3T7G1_9BACT|nr:hypothetical protein [Hymenobacter defluvii]MBO3269583.1 hypothetical protein [Hymenobacter defluvii]